jgi:hypothetical protein
LRNLCIQDPNNLDAERLDILLALLIVFQRTALKMAISIQLDSQLDLCRAKIEDKGTEATLPEEFASQQLTVLEPRPENHFGIGHRPMELAPLVLLVLAVEELVYGGTCKTLGLWTL